MKCVAYCRVSTGHEEQLTSLQNQIKHYTELFEKEGYEPAECGMYYSKKGKVETTKPLKAIFADEGISGTKLKNREAFKYMLECAYRKEFDIIYCKNISRWARSVEDGAGILKKLKVLGIRVIFEDGNLNNFDHEMIINVLLSTAQEESRAKGIAIKFGVRKAQEQGKWISACPYGYLLEKGVLHPISEQIEVVKKIYEWYLSGWGGTKISKQLMKDNIPTQKGGKWSQIHVYAILKNQIYIGKQVMHTVESQDVNVKCLKKVDEEKHIIIQNEELRAVTDEVFFAAQEEMLKRKTKETRTSTTHILSNLLYCRHCGRAMRRKKLWGWKKNDGTRNMNTEWICTNHDMYHNEVCKYRNSWIEDKLTDRIGTEIEKLKENKQLLDNMYQKYLQAFISDSEIEEQTRMLKDKLSDLKEIIDTNLRLLTKEIINDEQYKEQNDKLQLEKKTLETELYKLSQIENERIIAHRKYNNYVEFIQNVDITKLDNALLKKMINKIECFTIELEGKELKDIYIVWNFLDKSFDNLYTLS